jgi:hypothetical protein
MSISTLATNIGKRECVQQKEEEVKQIESQKRIQKISIFFFFSPSFTIHQVVVVVVGPFGVGWNKGNTTKSCW